MRDPASDVPPARLGDLVHAARRRAGLSRRRLAQRASLDVRLVRAVERGDVRASPVVRDALARACGVSPAELVPARAAATSGGDGLVRVAGRAVAVGDDPGETVRDYVAAVATLRGQTVRDLASLRRADLEALARVLGDTPGDIEARIAAVLDCDPELARRVHHELLRRRILVPVAGVALGATALGAIALADVQGHGAPGPVGVDEAEVVEVDAPAPTSATVVTTASRPVRTTTTAPPTTAGSTTAAPTTAAPAPPPPTPAPAPVTAAPPPPAPDVSVPPGETFVEVPAPDVSVPPGETFVESP